MAIWNRNKVPPANLNAGQQYNAEDWTSEQTFNVANNNAFYSVDFAEALADAPDNTEAGNIGTPTVTLIDNVKTIDGVEKTFKKFKFSNLKGEKYVHPNHSGDVTSSGDGVQTIANDAVTNAKLANMPQGTVKVGGDSDAPTDLNAKTSGNILIGDGTDLKSVAVSGDITITSAGVTAIGNNKVTNSKLAQMNTKTIKGNDTAGTANAKDMTVAEAKALLDIDDIELILNAHIASPMPHKMLVDGVAYNYGLSQADGFVKFIYEEEVE